MPDFTTRPEIRGTFGVVATTHWLASAVGDERPRKAAATRSTRRSLPGSRCRWSSRASERPARRGRRSSCVARRTSRCDMICGQGVAPAAATIAQFQCARARSDPRHRAARRRGARRLRRLDAAVARLRDDAARRAHRPGARLCRERLSDGRPASATTIMTVADTVPPRMAELGRGLSAGRQPAGARTAVPATRRSRRPTAGCSAEAGGGGARAADRARPRRLVSRLCRRGDRPFLPGREGDRRRRAGAMAGC